MGEAAISSEPQTRNAPGKAQPLEPGLYVVSTPIGNLRDVTLRALDVLAAANLVLAEDTRVSRKLFDAYGLSAALEPYHEHNADKVRPKVLERIAAGDAVALISDAGTPLVSDPGFKLVRAVIADGGRVTPIPGPSAALAALVAAGLPTDRFLFAGFTPPKSAARRKTFDDLKSVPATLVFYETGPRLADSLADMAAVFGARAACVARELTKLYEETRRGSLAELAAAYAGSAAPKGEIAVVVGPPPDDVWEDAAVDAALVERLAKGSLKEAAADVANVSGRPRREVYARALALKDRG